jgi:hypothetical protein
MAEPSSFYGSQPQIARLPTPGNPAAELAPGLNAVSRAVTGAAEDKQQTDLQVATHQPPARAAGADRRRRRAACRRAGTARRRPPRCASSRSPARRATRKRSPSASSSSATTRRHARQRPRDRRRFVDNIASIAATARTGEVKWAMAQRALKSVDRRRRPAECAAEQYPHGGRERHVQRPDARERRQARRDLCRAQPIPGKAG